MPLLFYTHGEPSAQDAAHELLHAEDIEGFNRQKPADGWIDLAGGDFRGLDLRGVDLREARLEGASLAHAQISGTYFPLRLAPDEIRMSVNFGTRLRYLPEP
ncbi:pentapeptide repeat-containing protein [Pseudomonas aeruginosa]|uniref:pentapeptide repeat-containing protein n=1 Tax=Pseudomonas aeruginosa TaxID=287 RepID=UPI000EB5DF04|nr:pentapeptide repeat-containing protein [Pseudomonas aeruginosa]